MKRIAITGNIASGKSQVEKILEERYPVYDSDKISHEILDKIKDFYGYDVFKDGKIDRKKLGALVFSNKDLKKKLEEIIHPQVKFEINKIFAKHKEDKFVFVSVPLLFEAGFETMFDKIILVSVNEQERLNRVMKRDNLSEKEALARIQSQIPEKEKIKRADFVINNNSSLNDLKNEIANVLIKLDD